MIVILPFFNLHNLQFYLIDWNIKLFYSINYKSKKYLSKTSDTHWQTILFLTTPPTGESKTVNNIVFTLNFTVEITEHWPKKKTHKYFETCYPKITFILVINNLRCNFQLSYLLFLRVAGVPEMYSVQKRLKFIKIAIPILINLLRTISMRKHNFWNDSVSLNQSLPVYS